MKTIYTLKVNADMTEGRGPMVAIASFASEDDAWTVADRYHGVMGHRPRSGTWRGEKYGEVRVEPTVVFDSFDEYDWSSLQK